VRSLPTSEFVPSAVSVTERIAVLLLPRSKPDERQVTVVGDLRQRQLQGSLR
jgi:hypothetical protein